MARFRHLVSFTTLLNIQGDLGGAGGSRGPPRDTPCVAPNGNVFLTVLVINIGYRF